MNEITKGFSIDLVTGDIRYIGNGKCYPLIDLHRHLFELAEDADIPYPSDRNTDRDIHLKLPFNVDAEAAKHLLSGKLTQRNGAEIFSDGVVIPNDRPLYLV